MVLAVRRHLVPFTILVVEEEPGAAEPLAEFLRARGCRVWTATRARDALTMLQRGWVRPSLLLVGLPGPRADFVQFLDACAAEPLVASVPVIAMSSNPDVTLGSMPMVSVVLPKPVAFDRLLQLVGAIAKGESVEPIVPPRGTSRDSDSDEPTDPGE
jgi:DNA-binding response OmpR family regulator